MAQGTQGSDGTGPRDLVAGPMVLRPIPKLRLFFMPDGEMAILEVRPLSEIAAGFGMPPKKAKAAIIRALKRKKGVTLTKKGGARS